MKLRIKAGLVALAVAAIGASLAISSAAPSQAAAFGDPILVGPPWSIAGAGKMHLEIHSDIVWYNSQTGETQIWFMRNGGVFRRQTVVDESGRPIFIGPPFGIVAVADFDNTDGLADRADIAWYNSQTGETQIWFMNGGRIQGRQTVVDESGRPIFIGPPFSIKGAADLDGNGRADLVWYNSQTGETQVWFMNGGQIQGRQTVVDEQGQPIFIGPPWSIRAVAEGKDGGKANLVWYNSQTGETQLWFMNGGRIQGRKTVVSNEVPDPPPPTSPPPSSPPPSGPRTQPLNLDRQPIVQGFVPYAAQFPPFGTVAPGHLIQIRYPQSGFPDTTLLLLKVGHSTTECGNSSAVVPLGEGQTTTPAQLTAIYGQSRPPYSTTRPLPFIACLASSGPLLGFVQIEITIQSD